jgi:hypothetical protein
MLGAALEAFVGFGFLSRVATELSEVSSVGEDYNFKV